MNSDLIISNTRRWVNEFVIRLNICPFARQVEESGRIRYAVKEGSADEQLFEDLISELNRLIESPREEIETTILICPNAHSDFLDFNDFIVASTQRLQELGFEGVIQIVGFHPKFQFSKTKLDAAENYTNRSPYPVIHILREVSITEVAGNLELMDLIPNRNTEILRQMGNAKLTEQLNQCRNSSQSI